MKSVFGKWNAMESERKKAQEVAENLCEMGLDIEKRAQAVGYAVETVKGWLGLV